MSARDDLEEAISEAEEMLDRAREAVEVGEAAGVDVTDERRRVQELQQQLDRARDAVEDMSEEV